MPYSEQNRSEPLVSAQKLWGRVKTSITKADSHTLTAIGTGDLHIELPNRSGKAKMVFRNAIHTPDMAFTLISISRLDQAGYTITFNKSKCTIKNPSGKVIGTIPHSNGLHKIAAPKHPGIDETANTASNKMTI